MRLIGLSACESMELASNLILKYFLIHTRIPHDLVTLADAIEFPDDSQYIPAYSGAVYEDKLSEILGGIVHADAIVICTPTRYTREGRGVWAFWEKLFGRDVAWKSRLKGKLAVVLSIGGIEPMHAYDDAKGCLESFGMEFFGGVVDRGLLDCEDLCLPDACYVAKVVHEYGIESEFTSDVGSWIDFGHKSIPDSCPVKEETIPKIESLSMKLGEALAVGATGI